MTGETGELRCTLLSCIFISIYSYKLRMVSMELRILLTSIYEREIGFVASYPNVTSGDGVEFTVLDRIIKYGLVK